MNIEHFVIFNRSSISVTSLILMKIVKETLSTCNYMFCVPYPNFPCTESILFSSEIKLIVHSTLLQYAPWRIVCFLCMRVCICYVYLWGWGDVVADDNVLSCVQCVHDDDNTEHQCICYIGLLRYIYFFNYADTTTWV